MSIPSVSVIIPVLNTKPWLHQCMDSVLRQTLKGIEIICVDNGSSDGSLELLQDYARNNSNVTVLQCPREGRLGGARNTGMRVASGKFIGFVDSDDYVSPSMFEQLHFAACDAGAEVAICNTAYFYEQDGRTVDALSKELLRRGDGFEIRQRPKLLRNLTSWNKLYSSNLLKRLDLRFPEGFYHEDHYFVIIALFLARRIATTPEPLYTYRKQRPGSICLHRGADNLHVFRVMEMLSEFMADRKLDRDRLRLLDELRVSRILALANAIRGKLRRIYFEKMQSEFRGIQLPDVLEILSPTEFREFRVIRRSGYLQYRLFRDLRWLYGTLRAGLPKLA